MFQSSETNGNCKLVRKTSDSFAFSWSIIMSRRWIRKPHLYKTPFIRILFTVLDIRTNGFVYVGFLLYQYSEIHGRRKTRLKFVSYIEVFPKIRYIGVLLYCGMQPIFVRSVNIRYRCGYRLHFAIVEFMIATFEMHRLCISIFQKIRQHWDLPAPNVNRSPVTSLPVRWCAPSIPLRKWRCGIQTSGSRPEFVKQKTRESHRL